MRGFLPPDKERGWAYIGRGIDAAVRRLLDRLPKEPQYPTQGATLFVDLGRRVVQRAFTPREVVEMFLEGRGANMFYLWNLLDPALDPFSPDVPIFGTGLLTGIVPSAGRGNCTGFSDKLVPGLGELIGSQTFAVAVNGTMILAGEAEQKLQSGDTVELVPALAGG